MLAEFEFKFVSPYVRILLETIFVWGSSLVNELGHKELRRRLRLAGNNFLAHCLLAGRKDDNTCMAATLTGYRCRKKRVNGNFCKQHQSLLGSMKEDILDFMKPFFTASLG